VVELVVGDDGLGRVDASVGADGVRRDAQAGLQDEEMACRVKEEGARFGEARCEEGVFPACRGAEFVFGCRGYAGAGGGDWEGLALGKACEFILGQSWERVLVVSMQVVSNG
jgi:hypothetical protein